MGNHDGPYTMRQLQERFKKRHHQLVYAMREYSIKPTTRIGNANLYSVEQLPQIDAALARISERSRAGGVL